MKDSRIIESILGDICINDNYGIVMRKWRNLFNVSQAELAEELRIQPSVISDYESGRRNSPGIVFIRNYVFALIKIGKRKDKNVMKRVGVHHFDRKSNLLVKDFGNELSITELSRIIGAELLLHPKDFMVNKCVFFYDNIIDTFASMSTSDLLSYMKGDGLVLIFSNVKSGRFPFIVLKLLSSIKRITLPRFVVFQGEKDTVSRIVLRMAKNSNVSLAIVEDSKNDIRNRLKNL